MANSNYLDNSEENQQNDPLNYANSNSGEELSNQQNYTLNQSPSNREAADYSAESKQLNNENPSDFNNDYEDSESNQRLKSGFSLVNLLLGLILLVTLAASGFLAFDKGRMMAQTSILETEINSLKEQIDSLKENKVEVSKNAADALAQIEKDELKWSDIIQKVDGLVPTSASGQPLLNILSYSGGTNGKISLSMMTNPATVPPYADVSRVLSIFNNDLFFKDAYVPSIAKSLNEQGQTTLSFVFNLTYIEPDVGGSFTFTDPNASNSNTRVPVTRNSEVNNESENSTNSENTSENTSTQSSNNSASNNSGVPRVPTNTNN